MSIHIQQSVSLHNLTTLQVGGTAKYFTEVQTEDEVREAVAFAKQQQLPIKVLGGGSNVLVADGAIDGLVVHMCITGLSHTQENDQILYKVKAGEVFDDVVAHAVEQGWWGLENLSHIPGSAGATPVQNVGAYGVEIQDIVTQVRVFDVQTETFLELTPEECQFGYRNSIFKQATGKDYIVTEVTFALSTTPQPHLLYKDLQETFSSDDVSVSDIRNAIIAIRSKKFPDWKKVGTAGSFFKNPIITKEHYDNLLQTYSELPGFKLENEMVKVPLGWILDKVLALKGAQVGSVGAYEQQALVLINHGDATAEEIETFANDVVARVFEKTKIKVEWEVTKFS